MYGQIFFISFFFLIGNTYCGYDYPCDYQFGDPSWNYSTIFHNQLHLIPPDVQSYRIYLTESKLIISFVCVNISDIYPNHARVSFASLFKRITVDFDFPLERYAMVNVLAMHHGYRRHMDD